MRTEIWYPAEVGSEAGKDKIRYDLREHLPAQEQAKIPDADNPWQPCDCYRDLPIDAAHGPYPVVVFLHGTAAFRTQSLTQMTHWASRGFVVVASDYPHLELKDALKLTLGADQASDAKRAIAALDSPSADLAFLSGRIAGDRKALVGYSTGGRTLKELTGEPGVRVLISMAASGVKQGASPQSALILGAMKDSVSPYADQQSGYESSPRAKRLIGLADAGHLIFTDLCTIAPDKGGLLQVAVDHGVEVSPLILQLTRDGCQGGLAPARAATLVNAATAAALEERLYCKPGEASALSAIRSTYPEVGEYKQSL